MALKPSLTTNKDSQLQTLVPKELLFYYSHALMHQKYLYKGPCSNDVRNISFKPASYPVFCINHFQATKLQKRHLSMTLPLQRIHKQHHEWTAPVALSAAYAHPVEHVLSNILPVAVAPMLFKSHIVVQGRIGGTNIFVGKTRFSRTMIRENDSED